METRDITSLRADITSVNGVTGRGTNFKKLVYGSFSPGAAVAQVLVHPKTALHHQELKRLNDMKSNFVSIAAGNLGRPTFLLDRVWASAKAFSQYLKSNGLK